MECGVGAVAGERRVECDDVGFAGYLVEPNKALATFFFGAGWVAELHTEAEFTGPRFNDASNVAHTDYSERQLRRVDIGRQEGEYR